MFYWSVVVETNTFVNVKQGKEYGVVGVHLVVGVGIPFVLNEGEEICCCLPVLYVGQLLQGSPVVKRDVVDKIVVLEVSRVCSKEQGNVTEVQGYYISHLVVGAAHQSAKNMVNKRPVDACRGILVRCSDIRT